MCGFVGALIDNARNCSGFDKALTLLRHRGPNHSQSISVDVMDSKLYLGHTRLSVIDLSDGANQPMKSEDGRYLLVFNGEIYNYLELRARLEGLGHAFHTRSDTEVLLKSWAQWGSLSLGKLDGMFAFTVLDLAEKKLFCARDPFGVKPLYYKAATDGFYFASELPAMLELLPGRQKPDLQQAYDYLVHGDYDSSERTFIDGVKHLLPGHMLEIDIARKAPVSNTRWWAPTIQESSSLTIEDAAEAVREQFLLNIKRQLRSDVPIGAALSGGIDSSAVVCAMRYLEPDLPIHTFTYAASEDAISEERWADMVNDHVGADAHKVFADGNGLMDDLDDLIKSQGEPFGSTSIYAQYRVFRLARENGITVTLDGQGADELLAGYSGYPGYRVLSLLSSGGVGSAIAFLRNWHKYPGRTYKLPALELARALAGETTYSMVRRLSGRSFKPEWLNNNYLETRGVKFQETRDKIQDECSGRRVVEHLSYNLERRGLPALLRHGDRNSMRFYIESRVPFLSTPFCDLLYSLPEEYLISPSGETKHVFRRAMKGIVPDNILNRKDKIGFATPEWRWMKGHEERVLDIADLASGVPIMNAQAIKRIVRYKLSKNEKLDSALWRCLNYILWHNLFCEK